MKKAVWYLKCKALTEKTWLDDTEMEEEGVAEVLLDDNAIAQLPRYINKYTLLLLFLITTFK